MTTPLRLTSFPCDYAHTEGIVATFIEQWRQKDFDAVIAIARGGLVAGVMAATALDLPLYALAYRRQQREVRWYSADQPRPGSRVLVVEDVAGRGTTLVDCLKFLQQHTISTQVFTLAHDRDSRLTPDYGVRIPDGYRVWFPWERESITATAGKCTPDYLNASWAIDLDGVLLPDIPEAHYQQDLDQTLLQRDQLAPSTTLPGLDLANVPIITGRPEQDRERTQHWLSLHGFHGPLVMRDPARHATEHTAAHKAQAILSRGHTHFLESDAQQALTIASITRVASVFWWNGRQATRVHASHVDNLAIS